MEAGLQGVQKKKKRPGRQARERMKAGLAVRPAKAKHGAATDAGAAASWPETLEEQAATVGDLVKAAKAAQKEAAAALEAFEPEWTLESLLLAR